MHHHPCLSLKRQVTNYREGGGLQNGRAGYVNFCPYEKGGGEKVLAMLKGGGTKSFGVVCMRKLEVLAIIKGGLKGFNTLKRGGTKGFTVLRRGGANIFEPAISPFCSPPPPSR